MARKALYIRVDESVHDAILSLSQETGLAINAVAEMLIARGLNKPEESATEKLSRLIQERFQ